MRPPPRSDAAAIVFSAGPGPADAISGRRQMADQIRIRKAPGKWTVRSGGAVLGETTNALELSEGELPPVIYFPRADIAMAMLDRSDKTTHCPHKGDATYFSIVNKSSVSENAAWSYESPLEAVEAIKDHLAFHTGDSIKVEKI
jgi:uncharacterized protein (DUF427 family)